MFSRITRAAALPNHLRSDNDHPFEFHRWEANLRILAIEAVGENSPASRVVTTVSVRIRVSAGVFPDLNLMARPEISICSMTIAGDRAAAPCISFRSLLE